VFALETNGLLQGDEANAFVYEPFDDLQNLRQTPSQAGEFAHDYPIPRLQGVNQSQ
jgi:hypothetical protein